MRDKEKVFSGRDKIRCSVRAAFFCLASEPVMQMRRRRRHRTESLFHGTEFSPRGTKRARDSTEIWDFWECRCTHLKYSAGAQINPARRIVSPATTRVHKFFISNSRQNHDLSLSLSVLCLWLRTRAIILASPIAQHARCRFFFAPRLLLRSILQYYIYVRVSALPTHAARRAPNSVISSVYPIKQTLFSDHI